MDSCLHVDSDDTCTTTVSLHAAQPENGDSTTEQVFIQYDMLPTKPLAFCSSLILKKISMPPVAALNTHAFCGMRNSTQIYIYLPFQWNSWQMVKFLPY